MRRSAADALAGVGAGLLLDLDGTLVDSEPVHRAAYREFFGDRGWNVPESVLRQFSGRRAAEVFASLRGPWTGEDPEALTEDVLAVLGRSTMQAAPVLGAARLLAACQRTGLPVAVVTSARRDWALTALAALGVVGGTVQLVSAEDCTHGKPDPEPYRRGTERLDRPAHGLVAVEDSAAGLASARAAGVGYALGLTTSQPVAALLAAGAHETAADLTALAVAVERRAPRLSPLEPGSASSSWSTRSAR